MPFNNLPASPKSLFEQPIPAAYSEIEQENIWQCTPCRANERDANGRQGRGYLKNYPLLCSGYFQGIKFMAKHLRSGYGIVPHIAEDQVH